MRLVIGVNRSGFPGPDSFVAGDWAGLLIRAELRSDDDFGPRNDGVNPHSHQQIIDLDEALSHLRATIWPDIPGGDPGRPRQEITRAFE
jgi:hypothetical protein